MRLKAAELQPAAEPEMQLVLYAEALLDLAVGARGLKPKARRIAEKMLMPPGWRKRMEVGVESVRAS